MNTCNTNTESYLEFIKELNMKLLNLNYNNQVLILENLSSHKMKDLIEYYLKIKINIHYNVPYISYFNAIELAFRYLTKIYTSLLSIINSQKERVIEILSSEEFKKSIRNAYSQTLNEYVIFFEEIKDKNLNNLYEK